MYGLFCLDKYGNCLKYVLLKEETLFSARKALCSGPSQDCDDGSVTKSRRAFEHHSRTIPPFLSKYLRQYGNESFDGLLTVGELCTCYMWDMVEKISYLLYIQSSLHQDKL